MKYNGEHVQGERSNGKKLLSNHMSISKIDILFERITGSPFKFHVDTISSGFVTAYGSGLTHGVSGEPCNFTISTKGAGAGTKIDCILCLVVREVKAV